MRRVALFFIGLLVVVLCAFFLSRPPTPVSAGGSVKGASAEPSVEGGGFVKSRWVASGRPDVVFVLIDSLRADHVGFWGYGENTTPFIDGLAADGLVFMRAYSQETYTEASVPSILGSLYPFQHKVLYDRPRMDTLADSIVTLPEVLHDNGYSTAAFVYNPHLKSGYNFDQGFDVYDDAPEGFVGSTEPEKYETASKIRGKVLGWLRSNRSARPFFLYLHYRDVHDPYLPPPPYDRRFSNVSGANPVADYDGEIAYTDGQLRLLMADLSGFSNDTVYVITADHGEEFNDHGHMSHGWSLYDELMHVPLIFYSPQRRASFVVRQPVELIDVAPTILGILNITPPKEFIGRGLWGALDDGVRFREYVVSGGSKGRLALIRDDIKYYVHPNLTKDQLMSGDDFDAEWSEEMYNLSSDPHERVNIISANPELADRFRSNAGEVLGQTGNFSQEKVDLDANAVKELQALGYLN